MENSSSSRVKENRETTTYSTIVDSSPLYSNLINGIDPSLKSLIDSDVVSIKAFRDTAKVYSPFLRHPKIIFRSHDLNRILSFIAARKKLTEKSFTQLKKLEAQICKKMRKVQDILSPQSIQTLANRLILESDFSLLALKKSELTACNLILNLGPLSHFNRCSLFFHKKGSQLCQIVENTHEGIYTPSLELKDFQNAFGFLKKSKQATFPINHKVGQILEIPGSFLGFQTSIKDFNIILILTQNSFLDIEKDLELTFQSYLPLIYNILHLFLISSEETKSLRLHLTCLENYPQKIQFFYKDQPFYNNNVENIERHEQDTVELYSDPNYKITIADKHLSATELFHARRVSLLGELGNTLSHELCNPLLGLQLSSEFLRSKVNDSDTDLSQLTQDISGSVKRCQDIISDFSDLFSNNRNKQSFNLSSLIKQTLNLTKSETRSIHIELNDNSGKLVVNSQPTWISQIVFNLVVNSAQAIQENGSLEKKIIIELRDRPSLQIQVSDSGPGIEDNSDKIFETFYTTKHSGTGLGLTICKTLARKLGGSLERATSQLPGASFVLTLPSDIVTTWKS